MSRDDGRPAPDEKPVGTVAEFAAELRELRAAAGSPSFRSLATITHYSSSALAEATSGKRLPSEAIVRAFAAGCGADPAQWAARLHRAAADAAGQRQRPPAAGSTPGPGAGLAAGRKRTGRRTAITVAAACALLVAGAVIGAAYQSARSPGRSLTSAGSPARQGRPAGTRARHVADGADPVMAGCVHDGRLVDSSPVVLHGQQIGEVEYIYSASCGGGWARAYLDPGQPGMLGQVTIRASDGRLSAFAYPLVRQIPIYTDVIVPGAGGCLAAQAVFHAGVHALATAATSCRLP
jgi:hypothetical protein